MYKLVATTKQVCDELHISAKCENTGRALHNTIKVKKSHKALVKRVIDAINAGVLFTCVKPIGETALIAHTNVLQGKYLAADLTKLGF